MHSPRELKRLDQAQRLRTALDILSDDPELCHEWIGRIEKITHHPELQEVIHQEKKKKR